MAEIKRLTITNPAANTDEQIFIGTGFYVVSVIVANTSPTLPTKIDIWIAPDDTATESEWGYIIKNASINSGNSLETFRFAVIADDYIYAKSDNGFASFTVVGINQT